jgi:hypothetical protein
VKTVDDAVRIVEQAQHPAGAVLVDALHLRRSGGSPADLAAVPTRRLPYAQLCDAPAGAGVAGRITSPDRITHRAAVSRRRTTAAPRTGRRDATRSSAVGGGARGSYGRTAGAGPRSACLRGSRSPTRPT